MSDMSNPEDWARCGQQLGELRQEYNPSDWARRGQQLGELRQENYQLKQRIAELEAELAEEIFVSDTAEKRIAELESLLEIYKWNSLEAALNRIKELEAENQRLRELFDRWGSSGDVVAASYAMQAKLVMGGGENG